MNILYEKKVSLPYNEALETLKEKLKESSFGVLWQLNFKDKLAEHDLELSSNFTVLEVCNPKKAHTVLEKHIDVGYFLPCKMAVYEKEGHVYVGMPKPETLIGMIGHEDLVEVAAEVETILAGVIDQMP